MKLNLKSNLTVITMIIIAIIIYSCKKKSENHKEVLNASYTTVSNIKNSVTPLPVYPDGWKNHNVNTPAPKEGSKSRFAKATTTNGIFHQWSWQKFLWLTKPSTTTNTTPIFLNQKHIYQVDSYLGRIPQQANALVVLDAIDQAGSNGHLRTNPDYNSNGTVNTVYYSIHVSPTFMENAKKFKDTIIKNPTLANNDMAFPVGSLEMKVSWVNVNSIPLEKQKNYYTTIAALSNDGGKTFNNTKVALLGMHVVGVVENHPEFIWATFEHHDLGPNYDWVKNKVSSTTDQLLFKKGDTTGLDPITINTKTLLAKIPSKAYNLFKYNVPVNPNGKFMTTSQTEPINFNNITSINNDAANNLKGTWSNYFYNGSIWINTDKMSTSRQLFVLDSLKYDISHTIPGSFARGSLNNANISMETFTQTFTSPINKINNTNLASCFSCHSSVSSKVDPITKKHDIAPIYISHIFDGYLQKAQGKSIKEIEATKTARLVKIINKHN